MEGGDNTMGQFIPKFCCDFILENSANRIDEITEALQFESTDDYDDWTFSTGEVRSASSVPITDILINLFPEHSRSIICSLKKQFNLTSIVTLKIFYKNSNFPFVVFDNNFIRFLLSTETEFVLSIVESDSESNTPKLRLKLTAKGSSLFFEQIENNTKKTPWFKRRKQQFPIQAQEHAENCWMYRTEDFLISQLAEKSNNFYSDFSNKGIEKFINSEKSYIELNFYGDGGVCISKAIPKDLIALANELSVSILIGMYAKET